MRRPRAPRTTRRCGTAILRRAFEGESSGLGAGCLADQLIGQWWAHLLELGHLLPDEHVRTALRTIVSANLRHGFRDFEHGFRVFADGDDTGLLICTWPDGGRPEVPVRYADEVWTGIEYEVAALCLFEGLVDEARAVLRCRALPVRRHPPQPLQRDRVRRPLQPGDVRLEPAPGVDRLLW